MAEPIGWITVNGVHVPLFDGQTKADAMKNFYKSKHGKDVARLSSKTTTKKKENKYTDSYESIEKAADDYMNIYDNDKQIEINATNFYQSIGYDELPKQVKASEFDRIANNNKFGVLERGYRHYGSKTPEEMKQQFINGDLYIGNQRAFGLGTYFGYGQDAHSVARRYGEHNDDNILKVTITGNSKIITTDDLYKKRTEFQDKAFNKAMEISKTDSKAANKYYGKINNILRDDGVFAAALGYDAINVTDAKYLVVLNRGKVIVSE